jgi:DNA/RNA-binding domain of Phe-tRNA-synthetase-like protein
MFIVSEDCVELGLRAGAVVITGIKINDSPLALREEINDEFSKIGDRFSNSEELKKSPELSCIYEIYRKIGVSPRKYQPASHRLLQLAQKGKNLPSINNLVDAYNLASFRSICCLGAHDIAKISLPIRLTKLTGSEVFKPLGSEEDQAVVPGEFGYVDADNRVICRLDVLQADFSKVTKETQNVLLIIEGMTAINSGRLKEIFSETINLITQYCGGVVEEIYFP